jgi:hypothetical protein
MMNKKSIPKFAHISVLVIFPLVFLSSCTDNDLLKAAAQLGSDGQQASIQYSQYMNNAADAMEQACDLENFSQLLAMRKSKTPIDIYLKQASDCISDANRQQTIQKLRSWGKDALAVADAYAALSKINASSDATVVQTSINNLGDSLTKATQTSISDSVKLSLGSVATLLVIHREATGIVDFATAMSKVPQELSTPLTKDARTLDKVFDIYDKDKRSAVRDAFEGKIADPKTLLNSFFDQIGIKPPSDFKQDEYFSAFAVGISTESASITAKQARLKLIDALQKLSDQTQKISTKSGYQSTISGDLNVVTQTIDTLTGILHPSTVKSTKAQ